MKLPAYICCIVLFGFMLGIHEGKIALWEGDDPEPVYIYPYSAQLLPLADQSALEDGIHFHSRHDLERLLGDYLS